MHGTALGEFFSGQELNSVQNLIPNFIWFATEHFQQKMIAYIKIQIK
jgi:hypothetical protein